MSRRTLVLCFLVGAAVFTYLVSRVGISELVTEAHRTGRWFPLILAAYGIVYVFNAAAWQVILADEPGGGIPFWRAYALITSGFAFNFLTPMLNFGGEPFKVAAAGRYVGLRRAAGSVLIHNVLRALSFLLGWVTALALAIALLPRRLGFDAACVGAMVAVAGLTLVLLSSHRRDFLTRMLDCTHRVPGLRALGRRLEPRREALSAIDAQMADFYLRTPRRFWLALGLEYLSRWALALEYYLILVSLKQPVGFPAAFVITGLGSLITTVLFFFPFEIGTKEGGLFVLFGLFGIPRRLGVYAALVSRVRDLAWIALGLALVWVARDVPASVEVEEQA